MYEIERLPQSIDIGFTGEMDFRTVQIDMSEWVAKMPEGQPTLMHIRPGEYDPYPVTITYENNIITWSVTDGDLGTSEGTGLLQVWFGVQDETEVMRQLGMSAVVPTIIHLSLAGEGRNSSTVQIPWLQEVMEMKNLILGYDYEAESWANGQRGGEDVGSDDPAYHNNAKYYKEQVEDMASDAEAYAAGTRGGEDVDEDDPAYENNAKYYNEQAALEKAAAQAAAETASAAYNVNLLAANYDATKTYAVGEYVIYSGGLYRCISAITTAEAWTAAHWVSVTVGKDTSALKSAIDSYLLPTTGGTKNLFDISLLKDATGITLVDGTTEFYGKASNMNFEISPNGIAILNGFPENQRFNVSAEAYNANATGTGLGIRCRVYYTDGTDDYLFAWNRNTSEYTTKSVATASGKTVEKIRFNYSSGGSDIWHIKNLQIEPGTAKTDYAAFSPTAIDQVARGNTSVVDNRTGNIDEAESNLFNGINVIDQTLVSETTRISKDTGEASSNSGTFATHFIPIREGMKLTMNKIVDSSNYGTAFYDINKVFIEGYASSNANKVLYAPKGAAFVRMTFLTADLETAEAYISAKVIDEAKAFTVINQKTKWIAVGDSITFGVYSKFVDGGGTDTGTFDGWVRLLAAAMNYDITVMASKGMGYTASVTGQDPEGGDTRISISTLLDRIVALEGDYNLITVSFGINDYNNPSQSTLQTILAGLDEAIQKLATRFKFARLVVITPFNSSRYGDGTTNFCYNYERSNNLSIKDIADAIKERCAYYGVECIYASNGFLLNNYNIETLLPDGVHPAKDTHAMIAKNMAHYLLT